MTDESQSDMTFQEVTLKQLFDRALAGWKTPAVFSALAVIIAIVLLSRASPVYQAQMSVVPAPSSQSEVGMTQTGGLGSLLGIMGGESNSSYMRYQKLLTSTLVAERMQHKYGMDHVVFAELWDAKEKKWREPQTVRKFLLGWLFKLAGVPIWSPPDITDLANYLDGKIIVVAAAQSDIVNISVRDTDPAFAKRIMTIAHQEANNALRDQVASRAAQQVAYLQKKLAQTTVQDYRQTLLSLLSAQEKTLMLTQTSAPYAAEVLTPAITSSRPVAPRPIFSVAIAIVIGTLIGVSVTILFGPDWFRRIPGIWQPWYRQGKRA